jgi:outer membrane protein assembly factor BamB
LNRWTDIPRNGSLGLVGLWIAALGGSALADDWPTYRHDAARSGITSETVSVPLTESWLFRPSHPPQPAWGDPKPEPVEGILELRRFHFDDAFQVAVADGAVYFGSSADHKIYSLEASTGRIRWTRITGGPIRLAPAVTEGRVYVGSDDGHAYCLSAEDGSVAWKLRAAPEDRRVLGHGKMISLWPVRSGVLVDDGAAYFTAGIFPGEGVFLFAAAAESGEEIWQNGSCGEVPQSRVSPQGYLLASKTTLYAPMGRVSPAAIDRATGELKFTTFFGKEVGGTYALLAGGDVYTGTEEMVGYRDGSRDRFATFTGRKLVVTEQTAYVATENRLSALDRKTFPAAVNRLRSIQAQKAEIDRSLASDPTDDLKAKAAAVAKQLKEAQEGFAATTRWKLSTTCHHALILAGDVLFAGGADQVVAVDAASGKTLWTGRVDGAAKGLAVAAGRLFVSTDRGLTYCFAPKGSPQHGEVACKIDSNPYDDSPLGPMFQKAAETILRETGVTRGYALVLGIKTGQLALELAKRSELTVYAVDPDAEVVAAARKALDAAGVYGARVCVDQCALDDVPYSDYFANLVVSESAMATGSLPPASGEIARTLKPIGGTVFLGQRANRADDARPIRPEALRKWLAACGLEGGQVVESEGTWAKLVRGPLPGSGSWTHLYGNAANTACGDDQRVHCPLGVLWFGHPGPGQMVNRHRRAAGPLSIDGRMFVQGENVVSAYDVYNGLKLWEREISGAIRVSASHDGSNLAVSRQGLFVAVGDTCLKLDPATGQTQATFRVPSDDGRPGRWGYLAAVGSLVYGSRCPGGQTSDLLFALDAQTGDVRWTHSGKRIPHIAVSIGGGRVHFIDSGPTPDERKLAVEQQRERIMERPEAERAAALEKADVRVASTLNAETGRLTWRQPIDLTDCGGGTVASMVNDGVLVFFGVYLDGHYWQQFFAGEFASRRVVALSAAEGEFLWSEPVGYRVRPLIVGDTLHTEPWAFDLHTGEPRTRTHPVTGQTDRWQFARPGHHCGLPTASPNCLFFRSYNLGYYDLEGDYGTMHFGAQRPGCWVNFIPAGGLLLFPEASAGCMCPFANMCTVVFRPTDANKAWAYYSAPGPMTPVERLGINLGAAGDRQDAAGNLWLGYPRPSGSLVLQFKLDVAFHPGGSFVERNSTYTPVAGTDDPWLFTSAAYGLKKCVIPLLDASDGKALYRVRLALADPDNDRPGRRVFDVKLQGNVVAENLDVAEAAGGRDRAFFAEFDGIEVTDNLAIELVPKGSGSSPEQAPILQGVEVVRQEVLSLGCAPPSFLLSTFKPQQTGDLRLGNLRKRPFEGTLQIAAPQGFQVRPRQSEVRLAAGGRATIPVDAAVAENVPAGDYQVAVRLLRADGTVELERAATIEHLGRRGRVVLHPIEDASVRQRYGDKNQGSVGVMWVDGGNQTMGDADHTISYMKFRLDLPGKPVDARLRIFNLGNPTGDSGRVCLVDEPWSEGAITYNTRPAAGRELARLGRVEERQVVECPLNLDLNARGELSLALDPTGCDGVDYSSREGSQPPELVVEYVPE